MRALVYNGPRDVSVTDVPDARIEQPTDVLVKITSTNICGSDLHIHEGRAPLESGMTIAVARPCSSLSATPAGTCHGRADSCPSSSVRMWCRPSGGRIE